ncbi:DUF4430 domain-containing protein [Anaerolentibacter hominis]|uniref:DUF4430 domain-containing protein n=1 Tax=Anaerolentibacter hominis TaxID=3079009 RepID=UPI0031B872AD
METKKNNTKKILIAVAALTVVVAACLILYLNLKPKGTDFDKKITVEIVYSDVLKDTYWLETNAPSLREALEERDLIEGEDGQPGFYITSVGGVAADESKEQWWCITKDGEMLMTGADDTMIADGEHYELTLKEGYDS